MNPYAPKNFHYSPCCYQCGARLTTKEHTCDMSEIESKHYVCCDEPMKKRFSNYYGPPIYFCLKCKVVIRAGTAQGVAALEKRKKPVNAGEEKKQT